MNYHRGILFPVEASFVSVYGLPAQLFIGLNFYRIYVRNLCYTLPIMIILEFTAVTVFSLFADTLFVSIVSNVHFIVVVLIYTCFKS